MLMVRIMEMLGGVSNTRIPPVIRGAQGKEEKGQKKHVLLISFSLITLIGSIRLPWAIVI